MIPCAGRLLAVARRFVLYSPAGSSRGIKYKFPNIFYLAVLSCNHAGLMAGVLLPKRHEVNQRCFMLYASACGMVAGGAGLSAKLFP
ncbi:hypothetical protein B0I18_1011099 [Taibaiella chishuiensis]|uniref:Uncharacterized protein n=1 Tax=Taibaiella chishuiensis TaxID=1434707 RepID=A0A2P8DCJ1_9BACT|nr:hypothetical protein B0I18_1011099 [Taibaiella chishuiensis]